jgi:hypothetical protein
MDLSTLTKQSMAPLPAFRPFLDRVQEPDPSTVKDKK